MNIMYGYTVRLGGLNIYSQYLFYVLWNSLLLFQILALFVTFEVISIEEVSEWLLMKKVEFI